MLAAVVSILRVFGYSLPSRRLEGISRAIPQVFAVAGIRRVLVAPGPGIRLYARQIAPWDINAPEYRAVSEIPKP